MTTVSHSFPVPVSHADVVATEQPLDLADLIAEHQNQVWRYLRYLGAERPEADDLTQETFLAVARRGFEQRGRLQTASYLRTVARNQLLMLRRTQRRRISTVSFEKTAFEAAESVWAAAEQTGGGFEGQVLALRECVDKLDGRAREVIELAYKQDLGRTEVAKRLDMKPAGVKTLLRRTRDALRKCVERATNRDR